MTAASNASYSSASSRAPITVSAVRPWRTALQRDRCLPFSSWTGAFACVATVGLDLPEGSHGELPLHQFKSQLPSDELGGTLQSLDRHVALCFENPIDLSAAFP